MSNMVYFDMNTSWLKNYRRKNGLRLWSRIIKILMVYIVVYSLYSIDQLLQSLRTKLIQKVIILRILNMMYEIDRTVHIMLVETWSRHENAL